MGVHVHTENHLGFVDDEIIDELFPPKRLTVFLGEGQCQFVRV